MTGPTRFDDDLDRAMHEDPLVPSSGFASAVMSAVRDDAATPAPIAFPWARVWPAAVAAVVLTAAPLAIGLRGAPASSGQALFGVGDAVAFVADLVGDADLQAAAVALVLTGLLLLIPRRLLAPR